MHSPSAFFARVRSRLDHPRWGLLLALGWLALVAAEARAADAVPVFARVADSVITQKDYDDAFAVAARSKFYHGKAPQAELAKLQREVGDALVNQALLLREARRRKLQPDAAAVQRQIDAYEARYRGSEAWQMNRAAMLPPLRRKLEQDSVLDQLHATVRRVDEPKAAQVEAYYDQHKDKFTVPEQVRLSMILLKVEPSSPQAKWDAAAQEGAAIAKRLRGGADFAQLAQLHSGDASAAKGGALDYLHRGMLPEPAQLAVDKLQPGGISDAVVLIEGIGVFRLDERKASKLNPLAAVRPRAQELLKRELGERAWTDLLARLRKEHPPRVDESRYLPLALATPQAPTLK
jgi:parvulin-like peptidyl-prolyl isomerase